MIVIPAIDLRDRRCVRLLQGDFDLETHYSNEPVAVAQGYAASGFRHLHVVDLDGALTGAQQHEDLVSRMAAETGLAVQLGGGIRDESAIERWLSAGVARCVIGSVAVTEPDKTAQWLHRFGPERVVIALDVRLDDDNEPIVATHGWTRAAGVSLWDCIERYRDHGLVHVLCTDIGTDGALSGPNLDLYGELIGRCPDLKLQASGGVRDLDDLQALRSLGCTAAITGRALLDGRITTEEIAPFLRDD